MSDQHAELRAELRLATFGLAYRMLGSVAEAEDIVQEELLRLHRVLESGEQLAPTRAYLATVTARLELDELRAARARCEQYVGKWLLEPLAINPDADTAARVELVDW